MGRIELVGWAAVALVLVGLTIPWFLWGSATVVGGLPVWLWWHVGWMLLAALVFWLFAASAWGIGIETADGTGAGGTGVSETSADGTSTGGTDGERR